MQGWFRRREAARRARPIALAGASISPLIPSTAATAAGRARGCHRRVIRASASVSTGSVSRCACPTRTSAATNVPTFRSIPGIAGIAASNVQGITSVAEGDASANSRLSASVTSAGIREGGHKGAHRTRRAIAASASRARRCRIGLGRDAGCCERLPSAKWARSRSRSRIKLAGVCMSGLHALSVGPRRR